MLSNLGSAIDPELAGQLREHGVPVLEGTRTGLLALRHLLDHAQRIQTRTPPGGRRCLPSTRPGSGGPASCWPPG